MKFGKTLASEAVPEWRAKYLDYRGLKKHLTQIKEYFDKLEEQQLLQRDQLQQSHSPSMLHPSVSTYSAFAVSQKSNTHASLAESAASSVRTREEPLLRSQHDDQVSDLPTSHAKTTFPEEPRRPSLLRRASYLAGFGARRKSRSPSRQVDPHLPFDDVLMGRSNLEKNFFGLLDDELEKIGEFFLLQKQKALETIYNIKVQLRAQSQNSLNEATKFSRLLHAPTNLNAFKFKKNQLKDAMLEFYRGLNLLRNFQIVNYTGLIKILKKFDKTADWSSSASYISARNDKLFWERDKAVQDLMKETEHLYCKNFTGGKRQNGMKQLRLPDTAKKNHQTVTWISGFCFGIGCMLLILIAEYETYRAEYFITLTQVYGGLFMPIFFSIAFVYALFIWSANAINYTFIFEFDPRNHIHYLEFLLFPSFLFCLWSIFFYLTFTHHSQFLSLSPLLLPLAYFCVCVLVFINPLPVFYRHARYWLIRASTRILLSPFHKITFSDFFLTDILCSLLFSLTSLPLFMCISFRQDPQCDTSKSLFTFSFALIPPLLRLIQCFRRWHDTTMAHPHLTNGVKYLLSCMVIVTSFLWRVTEMQHWFALWIVISIVATLFAIVWDLIMDWGLLRRQYGLLREHTLFSPPLVYYSAMLSNIVLRLGWVLQVSPGYWLPTPIISAVTLVCAFLESIRRVQWCIFRMENEHLYNCGQFRAVKDIPLPRVSNGIEEEIEISMLPYASPPMPNASHSIPVHAT